MGALLKVILLKYCLIQSEIWTLFPVLDAGRAAGLATHDGRQCKAAQRLYKRKTYAYCSPISCFVSFVSGRRLYPCCRCDQSPVDVTWTSTQNQTALRGYDATFVRSYIEKENQSKTETTGVACDFQGSGFNGAVQTPGIVNLPAFGAGSRPVTFTCTNGDETVVKQAIPYNVTSEERISAGASGGLLGVIVMAGVDAARDKSADTWGYRDVAVSFGN